MIETILGPIAPEQMHSCLTHEHFMVYGSSEASIGIREEALRIIVPRLRELREKFNCNALVECTLSASVGRDLETYAQIARDAQFHVIASTGFYSVQRSPWWMKDASVNEIVDRWKKEISCGMDGTQIKPGVLKATSHLELTDRRRKYHDLVNRWFEAMAVTHKESGLPITTHMLADKSFEQLSVLLKHGVDPSSVMICHVDSGGSLEQMLKVVDKGAFLSFNCGGGHFSSARDVRQVMGLAKALIDGGYLDQITLSMDAAFWPHQAQYIRMNQRLSTKADRYTRMYKGVFSVMIPALKKMGVTNEQISRMLVDNPRRYLDVG